MRTRRIIGIVIAVLVAGILLVQIIPFGRMQPNPVVASEPNWVSPQTRELAQRACFDCHSNVTDWPWYARVAPVSWLVSRDVAQGREQLNFSDWTQSHDEHAHGGHEPEEMREAIIEGEMPPASYLLMHPEARLTDAEKAALAAGLLATATGSDATQPAADHSDEQADDHAGENEGQSDESREQEADAHVDEPEEDADDGY